MVAMVSLHCSKMSYTVVVCSLTDISEASVRQVSSGFIGSAECVSAE